MNDEFNSIEGKLDFVIKREYEASNFFNKESKKVKNETLKEILKLFVASDEMTYQDALLIAIKKEKAAFKLYTDLAKSSDDENVKHLFESLAQEEAKHKLRLETIYDDFSYPEN